MVYGDGHGICEKIFAIRDQGKERGSRLRNFALVMGVPFSIKEKSMGVLLLLLLVLLFAGAMPAWPYSAGWGYAPSGVLGFFLVVLLVLLFAGAIPWRWNDRRSAPPPI